MPFSLAERELFLFHDSTIEEKNPIRVITMRRSIFCHMLRSPVMSDHLYLHIIRLKLGDFESFTRDALVNKLRQKC